MGRGWGVELRESAMSIPDYERKYKIKSRVSRRVSDIKNTPREANRPGNETRDQAWQLSKVLTAPGKG